VVAASKALFGQGELAELDERTLAAALSELPTTQVSELPPVADLLTQVGLAPSKSAARRTIKEGGAYLNNTKVTSEDAVPAPTELIHGRWLVLRRGKRNLAAVELA
jgi:tyrosyl-tRNA synthetase